MIDDAIAVKNFAEAVKIKYMCIEEFNRFKDTAKKEG